MAQSRFSQLLVSEPHNSNTSNPHINNSPPVPTNKTQTQKSSASQSSLCKIIKTYHGLLSPYYVFNNQSSRAFRFSLLLFRYFSLFVLCGMSARMLSTVQVTIGICMGCSILIRFVCIYLEYLMGKSYDSPKKFWFLKQTLYGILVIAAGAEIFLFYYVYNNIYEKKLVYWGLLLSIVYVFDLLVLDFIIIVIITQVINSAKDQKKKNKSKQGGDSDSDNDDQSKASFIQDLNNVLNDPAHPQKNSIQLESRN